MLYYLMILCKENSKNKLRSELYTLHGMMCFLKYYKIKYVECRCRNNAYSISSNASVEYYYNK